MMRRIYVSLICALLLQPVAGEELALDLSTAINTALKENRALARSALSVQSSELGVAEARAEFSTEIRPDGSAGASDGSSEFEYGLTGKKDFLWGTTLELGGAMSVVDSDDDESAGQRRAVVSCEIQQPLFRNFGALVHGEGLRLAGSALKNAARSYEQQKADLVVEVVDIYERIVRYGRSIRSDEAFFNRTEKLYRLTKAREQQGHTTRVDTLRVELQRGEAQSRLENNRERLYSSQRDLAELLGCSLNVSFELEPPPRLDIHIPLIEDAVLIAMSNRLDYATTIQDYLDKKRAYRIACRGHYPNLTLIGRYQREGNAEHMSEAWGLEDDSWYVGVAADTDLNTTKTSLTIVQSRLNLRSAYDSIRIKEISIAREVQQAISSYRRALTDVKIDARNFSLAESRAKLARRLFEIGRGDNFSATDAEQALLSAENQMLTAQAAVSVAGYRLLRTLGTLIEYPEQLRAQNVDISSVL